MRRLERLRQAVTNRIVHHKIQGIAPGNLYARTYATYYQHASRNRADLKDASQALTARVDSLIGCREHYYDLEALEKGATRMRVRHRRGDAHDVHYLAHHT